MGHYENKVHEFHVLMQPETIKTKVTLLSDNRMKLRFNLIMEELLELAQATGTTQEYILSANEMIHKALTEQVNKPTDIIDTVVASADALGDLIYVVAGTVVEMGFDPIIDDVFNEIHRSNMTKACVTIEEANDTKAFYENQRNTPCYVHEVIVENKSYYVVRRVSDHKVLKSIQYSPANLKLIINNHLNNTAL